MASPFSVFRKHQKGMIATLAILAIFAFCVPVGFMQLLRSGGATDPVVVETSKYGNLRASEIEAMRQRRQKVLSFLTHLKQVLPAAGGDLRALGRVRFVRDQIGPATEEAVVNTWLYARRAEQLGLPVGDRAINDFIKQVTANLVKPAEVFKAIRVTHEGFFELLRHELLALRLKRMFAFSLLGSTPAQRWDYFTRVKRRATIEVIPVSVADYVDQVEEPEEETLREFFEEHKTREASPDSPQPGFRKPPKIAFRYFKADYEKFMAPDVLTEDEIKEYYQKHKERIDRMAPDEKAPDEKAPDEKAPDEKAPDEKAPDEKAPDEKPSQEKPPEDKAPDEKAPDEKAPDEKAPQDKAPEKNAPDEKATQEKPPEEKAAGEKVPDEKVLKEQDKRPADQPPTGPGKEADQPAPESNDSGDTSSTTIASPFSPVSLLQQQTAGEPTAEPPKPAAEPKQPTAEPPKPAAEPKQPTAEPPKPAAEPKEPTAEPPKPAAEPKEPTAEPPKPPAQPKEPIAEPPRPPAQPKDGLTDRKRDIIRKELASELASEKIDKILAGLAQMVSQYGNKYVKYEVLRKKDKNAVPPEEPDYDALADKYGLTTEQTRLMSRLDARDSELGECSIGDIFTAVSFEKYAYESPRPKYVPETSVDLAQFGLTSPRYLFWKVKETKPRPQKPEEDEDQSLWHGTPEFEDQGVAEEVLQAWKMVQARTKAIDAAEELAAQVGETGLSLRSTFAHQPEITVISAGPFSWMTYGNVPSIQWSETLPRLNEEVPGLVAPGPDFMRTVFDLKKGGMGVAMNRPKTTAYVIRVDRFEFIGQSKPVSESVAWSEFLADRRGSYMNVSWHDLKEMRESWLNAIKADVGFKWLRAPRQQEGE